MSSSGELDRFTCAVCKELFTSPVIISCEHTFCGPCLDTCIQTSGERKCPICRVKFEASSKSKDAMMERAMQITRTRCSHCGTKIVISLLKSHQQNCGPGKLTATANNFPQGAIGYTCTKNLHTFSCPYCHHVKLDTAGLLKHVNEVHKGETQKVVCPICSAMPWGNPSQISTDFIQHINLRHRFEYDRFVDFKMDEKLAYERTLAKSTQEF